MLTAMKRFRRRGVRQQTSLCADANRRLRPNPDSIQLCSDCQPWFPSISLPLALTDYPERFAL